MDLLISMRPMPRRRCAGVTNKESISPWPDSVMVLTQ